MTIRPIITIDGGHHTNETFFDHVRVPKSSLIGEVNKGWTYAKLLLGHERTSIARIGQSKRELALKALAADQTSNGSPLIGDPGLRKKIAAIEIDLAALEITALRAIAKSGPPGVEANLLKVKGSRLTELFMDVAGLYGLQFDPSRGFDQGNDFVGFDEAASLAPNYLNTRVVTIYGGSNEIQRNIIAKTLGLGALAELTLSETQTMLQDTANRLLRDRILSSTVRRSSPARAKACGTPSRSSVCSASRSARIAAGPPARSPTSPWCWKRWAATWSWSRFCRRSCWGRTHCRGCQR